MSAVTAVPIRPLAKGSILKLWIAVAILCVAGIALAWFGTGSLQREVTDTGIQYQVIEAGEGPTITPSDLVQFHVVGRRADGSLAFSTLGREPLTGTTAPGGPLPVVSQGLAMMRNGAHYRFWAPARLAFKDPPPPSEGISPDEVFSFDVNVAGVLPGLAGMQMGLPGMGMGPPPGAGPAPGGDPHAGLPPEAGAPILDAPPVGNAQ
jgi:FKBP-type peptidyl-prolyl cis-trans isomerase FkpA